MYDVSMLERKVPIMKKIRNVFVTQVYSMGLNEYVPVSSWETIRDARDDIDMLKKYHNSKIKKLKKLNKKK